jgi:hypothetical protein
LQNGSDPNQCCNRVTDYEIAAAKRDTGKFT